MYHFKIVIFVISTLAIANGIEECPGCKTLMDPKEAEVILNDSLNALSKLDGPYYKIDRIISGTQQVIVGIKYEITADLLDNDKNKKTCDIEILAKPGLKSEIQVTFKCLGEADVVKTYIKGFLRA